MEPEGLIWSLAGAALIVLAAFLLVRQHGLEPFGLYRINDFAVEKVRRRIITECSAVSVAGLSIEDAENILSEVARHAIAKAFSELYPGKPFEVKPSWPQAKVIISGNIAVIKPWIGHDYADNGDGVKAINVEVNMAPALNLDKRRPLKAALSEVFDGPEGTLKSKAQPQKPESQQPAKPKAKPVPARKG